MEHLKTNKVVALYFSPTHTTRKVVEAIAEGAAEKMGTGIYSKVNITTPLQRRETPVFGKGDLVIFGVPDPAVFRTNPAFQHDIDWVDR